MRERDDFVMRAMKRNSFVDKAERLRVQTMDVERELAIENHHSTNLANQLHLMLRTVNKARANCLQLNKAQLKSNEEMATLYIENVNL